MSERNGWALSQPYNTTIVAMLPSGGENKLCGHG